MDEEDYEILEQFVDSDPDMDEDDKEEFMESFYEAVLPDLDPYNDDD